MESAAMIDIELSTAELLRSLMALVFLAAMVLLSRLKGLKLEKDILYSGSRAILQLAALGFVVFLIFSLKGFFIFLLLAFMVLAAAHIASKRSTGPSRKRNFQSSFISIALASSVVIGVALLTGVMDPSATFIIPLGGMVIGNSMLRCTIAYERLDSELRKSKAEIESYLSLGASGEEASQLFVKKSQRAAIYPSLDNLKATGIVWIPGLMAGMILAGADPIWAAELQIIIQLMIHSAAMLTAVLATELIKGEFFNEREQLVV